jgi:hypothetical protein
MSTFLDNHDVPRAIEHALDTPMFDPWDGGKSGAWTGQAVLPTTSSPFERLFVAYAFLFTSPGIPMLYYVMQWSGYTADQQTLHDRLASLAKVRRQHDALRRGTRAMLGVGFDTAVYKMSSAGDTVFVALNRGDGAQPATGLPSGTYTDLIGGGTVSAPLTIPPRSAFVLAPQ